MRGICYRAFLALAVWTLPAQAQFGAEAPAGWSMGLRAGPMFGITEYDDEAGLDLRTFVRKGMATGLELEMSVGYNRASGNLYSSDIVLGDLTLHYSPFNSERWNPYGLLGVGLVRYDLDEDPSKSPEYDDFFGKPGDDTFNRQARRLAFVTAEPSGLGASIPIGVGIGYKMSDNWLFEAQTSYTYTFLDDIDGTILKKGNDGLWALTLGFTYTRPGEKKPMRATQLPAPVVEAPVVEEPVVEAPVVAAPEPMPEPKTESMPEPKAEPVVKPAPVVAAPKSEALQPIKLDFPMVYFASGSTSVTAGDRKVLEPVVKAMKADGGMILELRGYTDSYGSSADNWRLSFRRAQSVKEMLVSQGIESWRIGVRGLGSANPVAPNDTPAQRAKNRRVEMLPMK